MMVLFKGCSLIAALFVAFGICANANAQTAAKCADGDTDCIKAEQKVSKADNDMEESSASTDEFTAVKTALDPGGFAIKPSKTEPLYGTRSDSGAVDSTQQQLTPEEEAQELAKKLSNPVASLISVPFQSNFDFGLGPNGDGFKYTLNFQPVIPIKLNDRWNLISRTILPIIGQKDVVGTTGQFGLGDTVQSFFFSPNKTVPFIWAIGPVVLVPTGTNEYLGTQKLGLGPTFLILKQQRQWTIGFLTNHVWSVAGKSTRANVSSTFLQPFVSYTTKTAWTYTLNTESTYDWTGKVWSVPIHFQVTKLVKIGKQRVSVGGGLRCWAASGPTGPEGCGFRVIVTPLFPKK